MSNAMQTIRTLRPAVAQVAIRQTALLCIKGSLAPHEKALARWWEWLRSTPVGGKLACWQGGDSPSWRKLSPDEDHPDLLIALAPPRSASAPRWLQFSSNPETKGDGKSAALLIEDLPPVMGLERASLILLHLPDDTPPAAFTQLGESSLQLLPLWWGMAGYALGTVSGPARAGRQWLVERSQR